jgi:hypothetical protein
MANIQTDSRARYTGARGTKAFRWNFNIPLPGSPAGVAAVLQAVNVYISVYTYGHAKSCFHSFIIRYAKRFHAV